MASNGLPVAVSLSASAKLAGGNLTKQIPLARIDTSIMLKKDKCGFERQLEAHDCKRGGAADGHPPKIITYLTDSSRRAGISIYIH